MSYTIVQFDDLAITPYLQSGDVQDLGTGAALTSFLSLPGGGFYDNYQANKSPQGIRPISKSGVFWGTDAELRAEIDAWRAKIGARGRLTVLWDDGSLRWQWARLQNLSTPRGRDVKLGWMPVTWTWITAAQNWRGVEYSGDGWTWGDDSWLFGDGAAEFGVGSQTFTLSSDDESVTVTHNGSIDAPNVTLRFDATGPWQNLSVINETTGQTIDIVRGSATPRPWIEINAGARTIYLAQGDPATIGAIYRSQNYVSAITDTPHGLTTSTVVNGVTIGDPVRIEGTGIYDGTYYPAITAGTNTFEVAVPGDFEGYGSSSSGIATALFSLYNAATISDRKRWLVLAPGDNVLRIIWSTFPTSAALTVDFVDHYG